MSEHSVLHPHGYGIILDAEGPTVEFDTLQCVHCMAHWRVEPGSGKVRGFCTRCNGPICGPGCPAGTRCIPSEQWLDYYEKGLDLMQPGAQAPVKVNVPNLWLPGSP